MYKSLLSYVNSNIDCVFNTPWVGMEEWLTYWDKCISFSNGSYPPYNVYEDRIEVALAGFKEEEIKVELLENILSVSGKKSTNTEEKALIKKIASREFICKFTVSDKVEIGKITFIDGLLTIRFNKIEKVSKPKVFHIFGSE